MGFRTYHPPNKEREDGDFSIICVAIIRNEAMFEAEVAHIDSHPGDEDGLEWTRKALAHLHRANRKTPTFSESTIAPNLWEKLQALAVEFTQNEIDRGHASYAPKIAVPLLNAIKAGIQVRESRQKTKRGTQFQCSASGPRFFEFAIQFQLPQIRLMFEDRQYI